MLHCTPTLPTSKHNDLGSEECQGTPQSQLHIPTVIHLGRVFSEKNAKVLLEWSSEKYSRGAYRGDTTGNAQRLFEWSRQKYVQKQLFLYNRGHSDHTQPRGTEKGGAEHFIERNPRAQCGQAKTREGAHIQSPFHINMSCRKLHPNISCAAARTTENSVYASGSQRRRKCRTLHQDRPHRTISTT